MDLSSRGRSKPIKKLTLVFALAIMVGLIWLTHAVANVAIADWYLQRAAEQLTLAYKAREEVEQIRLLEKSRQQLNRAESFQEQNPQLIALRVQQLNLEKSASASDPKRRELLGGTYEELLGGLKHAPTSAEFWARLAVNFSEREGFTENTFHALDRAIYHGPMEYYTVYANTVITLGGGDQLPNDEYVRGWEMLLQNAQNPDFSRSVRQLAQQMGRLDQLERALE